MEFNKKEFEEVFFKYVKLKISKAIDSSLSNYPSVFGDNINYGWIIDLEAIDRFPINSVLRDDVLTIDEKEEGYFVEKHIMYEKDDEIDAMVPCGIEIYKNRCFENYPQIIDFIYFSNSLMSELKAAIKIVKEDWDNKIISNPEKCHGDYELINSYRQNLLK